MKNKLIPFLIIFASLSCAAQTIQDKEKEIRLKINAEFNKIDTKCSNEVNAITQQNGKTEFWRICNLKNENRIIKIDFHEKDKYYQEIYFEKNGELRYAKETQNYVPKNYFTQMQWNCEFYAEKGELIALISLGHGKTESDEWEPESIFEMYKNRLTQLVKIKKK